MLYQLSYVRNGMDASNPVLTTVGVRRRAGQGAALQSHGRRQRSGCMDTIARLAGVGAATAGTGRLTRRRRR
jgi:hypothetical protein